MKGKVLKLILSGLFLLAVNASFEVRAQEKGQSEMFELLKDWCDAMIEHQLDHSSKHQIGRAHV